MSKKKTVRKEKMRQLTFKELGKFTDEILLPGVETIVNNKIKSLQEEISTGFNEMRRNTKDIQNSIRQLAGEIIELKVQSEDQKHEERIKKIERKLELHAKS